MFSATKGGSTAGYQISRSVRLRSSASAYFNRTPASAGNRKTWTWSGWVKRGAINGNRRFILGTNNTGGVAAFYFEFNTSEGINVGDYASPSWNWQLTTTQVFRDPSAWYHIVLAFDSTQATSSNRVKLYINGVQVTAFGTATYPSLNYDSYLNNTTLHTIGDINGASLYFDGYLTEINFIDGQALTPASFGETNPVTGVWQPKKYTGTYGTNGFYLNFSDNSAATATAIGKDYSGNGNNWTPNNISVTSGATYDSMLDVPTQWADGGNGRGNYCTFNPLFKLGATAASTWASSGNLQAKSDVNASLVVYGTMGLDPSTKFYNEFTIVNTVEAGDHVGIVTDIQAAADSGTCVAYRADGQKIVNGTVSSYGASYTDNDVIGIAVDLSSNQVTFYKNGVSQGAITGVTSGTYFHRVRFNNLAGQQAEAYGNWGQRPFSYTPPSGFKALNTLNLPTPTILKGNQYFNTVLYTGNGGTLSVTGVGFQPDFVWLKSRGAARSHRLWDVARGPTNGLSSDLTNAEYVESGLTAFNSDGFTLGSQSGSNTNAESFVAWNWKEGATQGFDIVTYTGNGANRTIAHNLGVAPSFMIVKRRNTTSDWIVWHSAFAGTEYIALNSTAAKATGATIWNSTSPTSSVFSVGTSGATNGNTDTYVNYLFAEVAGFSKFGSYTGNGSTDGPFVFCGFRPRWVMTKRTDTTGPWQILDTARDTYNSAVAALFPNTSGAEASFTQPNGIDYLSNGFKLRNSSTDDNANGGTYIFAAFCENPFKNALAR